MKKIIKVLILILAALVLASCANHLGQVTVTSIPVDTTAKVSPPAATAKSSPTDTVQQLLKEDVPAYLTVGLEKRSDMPPEWERYYYESYYWDVSLGPYSDEGNSESALDFDNNISIDLDGDGKKENITLIGGSVYEDPYLEPSETDTEEEAYEGSDFEFSDITIDIDGNKLKLKDEDDLPFMLSGTILDIDKNDGKKEILIEASAEEGGVTDYIITYDNKEFHKIFIGNLSYTYDPAGTGYIMTWNSYLTNEEKYDFISYYELRKLKSDRSGFEPAGNKYYPTDYQDLCWNENGNWDESQAVPTMWEEYLYKEPGGNEKVLIKKGTSVFIGLYAKKSWLMILSAKGELLGWLDADKVDFAEYTDYAFEPEGD